MSGNAKTIEWDDKAVSDVREEKELYKKSEDLVGMQDILESVILKTSHLPLEFIQNAEDEESSRIGFHLHDSALLIYNDGNPFRVENDRNDIKGFCSIGVSQKYKKGIGFLGVGSKTVYKITKKPWVVSGQYNFDVENMLYPSPRQEFPPHASEIIRKIEDFPQKGAIFYSPLSPSGDGKQNAHGISEVLENLDQSIIMFLESVKTVEVKDVSNKDRTVTFRQTPVEIYVDDDALRLGAYTCKRVQISTERSGGSEKEEIETNEWVVGNLNIRISDEAKKDLPASRLYDKKRDSRITRVSVAIPINPRQKKLYPLHCYLPLRDSETGLPLILQGDFIPGADRNHARTDSLWNDEILESLGILFSKVVQTCSEKSDLDFNLPDLVPWEEEINPQLELFVASLKREMLKTKFKLEDSPGLVDLDRYVVCNPDMRFLSNEDFRSLELNNHFRLFLKENSRLRRSLDWIGVRKMTAEDVFKILLHRSRNTNLNAVWVFDCYYSLAKADERDGIDEQLLEDIGKQKWLLTNKRRFTKPHERLYFRMTKGKKEIQHIEDFMEVEFLHPIFTTFSGSYKYGVDRKKREAIRKLLIGRFAIKILEDEGHLVRKLVIPLLESSEELSREKRIQHFTALLYYHEKLQRKLMKDGGRRNDYDWGKKRLQEICKRIRVPVTTFSTGTEKQISSGSMPVDQVYLRGRRNRPGPAFSVFGKTPGVYFLSPLFQRRVFGRIGFDEKQFVDSLEKIGISTGLKILNKSYSGGDSTPFWVRTDLVDWNLRDYEVPGLDKLDVDMLREHPAKIEIVLKELSKQYKPGTYDKGFLEAILSSSRTQYKYDSSITRALDRLELKDGNGKPHRLEKFVFGGKFTELMPNHEFLAPFNTRGLEKLLKSMQMRSEPTVGELVDSIVQLKKKYEQKEKNMPLSEIQRLCRIYLELYNYENVAPEIYLISPDFASQWFKPADCFWSDPTNQLKKYHPVIGDFYKKVDLDKLEIFKKFGVNPFPSVDDIFRKISALRKNINKKKSPPSFEEINELRCYYKYLEGKEINDKFKSRKIFLTDSGKMVEADAVYISRNIELHRVLSGEMPERMLNRNLIQGFPEYLERSFRIRTTESTINENSLPSGTENHDLSFLLGLLIKMVATFEYEGSHNTNETLLTDLQELSENIKVLDTEKIEISSELKASPILLDALFLDKTLYLTDIRDSERLLSRIREYGLPTILRGYSNNTINFASQLIAGGLDIDKMQESFFKQGYSGEGISRFLNEMKIAEELRSEEDKGEEDDISQDDGEDVDSKEQEKEDTPTGKKRKKEAEKLKPDLANPSEYEIEGIKDTRFSNGEGKEIGFRKRGKAKRTKHGPAPPPPAMSNLGIEETGIEFVKKACRELFGVQKDDDIKDVHNDLNGYDVILFPSGDKKYIELKASLYDPAATLTRDEFEKARIEKENYYLFLVGNIKTDAGDVYCRFIRNPASHKYVRTGGARLKDINWKEWGSVKFGKRTKKSITQNE